MFTTAVLEKDKKLIYYWCYINFNWSLYRDNFLMSLLIIPTGSYFSLHCSPDLVPPVASLVFVV